MKPAKRLAAECDDDGNDAASHSREGGSTSYPQANEGDKSIEPDSNPDIEIKPKISTSSKRPKIIIEFDEGSSDDDSWLVFISQ
jgi:hypothetical protein